MISLFEAVRYDQRENRMTAVFAAVFERLGPAARCAWIPGLKLSKITAPCRIDLQVTGPESVPDAVLRWGDELIVALESKTERLGRLGEGLGTQLSGHRRYLKESLEGRRAARRVLMSLTLKADSASRYQLLQSADELPVEDVYLSWQDLTRGAETLVRGDDQLIGPQPRLLLREFAEIAYREGVAMRPTPALDIEALRSVLPALNHLRVLRRTLTVWLQGVLDKAPCSTPTKSGWEVKSQFEAWAEFSLLAERRPSMTISDDESSHSLGWRVEVCGPVAASSHHPTWPPDAERGLALRVGFCLWGLKSYEGCYEEVIRRVRASRPEEYGRLRLWENARRTYAEAYTYLPFDPSALGDAARRLLRVMGAQAAAFDDALDKPLLDGWSEEEALSAFCKEGSQPSFEEDPPSLVPPRPWMERLFADADGLGEGEYEPESGVADPGRAGEGFIPHSGEVLNYRWKSRRGYAYQGGRWSCCGEGSVVDECSRTIGRHHPGELRGSGSRRSGGNHSGMWTCCGQYALEPGCCEGEPTASGAESWILETQGEAQPVQGPYSEEDAPAPSEAIVPVN